MGAGRVPRGHPAGQSAAASLQGAFKKYEFLPLTPCFSWVNEGRRTASTVLTVSLILRAFESILELTQSPRVSCRRRTGELELLCQAVEPGGTGNGVCNGKLSGNHDRRGRDIGPCHGRRNTRGRLQSEARQGVSPRKDYVGAGRSDGQEHRRLRVEGDGP